MQRKDPKQQAKDAANAQFICYNEDTGRWQLEDSTGTVIKTASSLAGLGAGSGR